MTLCGKTNQLNAGSRGIISHNKLSLGCFTHTVYPSGFVYISSTLKINFHPEMFLLFSRELLKIIFHFCQLCASLLYSGITYFFKLPKHLVKVGILIQQVGFGTEIFAFQTSSQMLPLLLSEDHISCGKGLRGFSRFVSLRSLLINVTLHLKICGIFSISFDIDF